MALRVGIDLVSVASVQESLRQHASHYLQRIYTADEVRDCQTSSGVDPQRLAVRFAAKEATLKVLRPGKSDAVPWTTIEVHRNPSGWTQLRLSGPAAALAADAGLGELALSLTHEGEYASAVVVADCPSYSSETQAPVR
jgi:holo-[acyl-carrier protein] synthase